MLSAKEYTIEEYIAEYKDTIVTLDTLFFKAVHNYDDSDSYVMNEDCILDNYRNDLFGDVVRNITGEERDLYEGYKLLSLNTKEFGMYKFNPKKLCYDLYGTTELWFLLLRLNEMHSVTEFNINPVKVFSITVLDKINDVLNREEDRININQDEVNKAILAATK